MLLGNPPKLPCYYYYFYTTTLQHHPPFTVSHFEAKNGVKTMQCILKFWSDIFETDSTNFSTILLIRLYKSMKNSFWFLLNQSHNSKGEQSFFSENYATITELRYYHQICIDMLFCTLLIQNCSQYLFYLCMCTVYILVYRNRRSLTGGSKRLEAGDGNLRGCFYRLSYFSTPIHLICVTVQGAQRELQRAKF